MRQKLPAGFQTAEFMLEHGMIDMVVSRSDLRDVLDRLLRHYVRRSNVAEETNHRVAEYTNGKM
jgi:acetyl-CoA carboxylase carboxyl transferase subunit beta